MSRRAERLNKVIKQEISDLLEREIDDPRLNNLISVTEVSISPDFKYAKVFVSVLGSEKDKADMLTGFNAASGFLRRKLSSRLRLKCAPCISFYCDNSIERGARISNLFEQVDISES